jgi:hypothetical protein
MGTRAHTDARFILPRLSIATYTGSHPGKVPLPTLYCAETLHRMFWLARNPALP